MAEGISILVVTEVVDTGRWLRWTTIVSTLVLLVVLLSRVMLDIWQATTDRSGDPGTV